MKKKHTEVWVGSQELNNDPDFLKQMETEEFFELPIIDALANEEKTERVTKGSSRRDFLKYMGFGLGAATIAASCKIPVKKGIPYVVKPDTIVPGVATYYASAFVKGGDFCPVVVKTREGRPIKVEGNALSSMTKGGTSARVQASVLELYDTSRLKFPGKKPEGEFNRRKPTEQISWAQLDEAVRAALNDNANVRLLSNTILSPTTKKVIADFTAKYGNTTHIVYDPISSSAILQANEASFGPEFKVIPNYHFDEAKVVVSLNADFLGTWISPVEYTTQFTKNRKIKDVKNPDISRLICLESSMSLTGSNADNRIMIRPSEMGIATIALHNEVARLASQPAAPGGSQDFKNPKAMNGIKAAAKDLWDNRNNGVLVVSGSNNTGEQILVNNINQMLGAYDKTLDFKSASHQRQGVDADVQALIEEMNGGKVDVLIVLDEANPIYDLPNGNDFAAAIANVKLSVSCAGLPNETQFACQFSAPTHNYLESWGDAEPKTGEYYLIQPVIQPLFDTRPMQTSLLKWADSDWVKQGHERPYHAYLADHWEQVIFAGGTSFSKFQSFWDNSLHDGVFVAENTSEAASPAFIGDINTAAGKVSKPSSAELEISFFEPIAVGNGQYANNPWLQEMPDPLTRCVWDNLLLVPIKWDGNRRFKGFKGLDNGDMVEVTIGENKAEVPTYQLFGQMDNTVAIALGYGRKVSGRAGIGVGKNFYPMCSTDADGNTQYYAEVSVSDKVGEDDLHACVQYHHTMGVKVDGEGDNIDEIALMTLGKGYQGALTKRTVIRTGEVAEMDDLLAQLKKEKYNADHLNEKTLYPYDSYKKEFYDAGHHWAMSIDLSACTGCGACQVACIAENNVPIVGKKEVKRHHEMTWLRIDRYFYGDYENPSVVYQPMMCQHCDNAPCENVCPVAATNHSSEGLNQMTYNRCIGTRYCANNCPYKVRRFNWYDYNTADIFPWNERSPLAVKDELDEFPFYGDPLTRMVLNPDVTVRSRGVIEKCSFCVQRIQEGKLTAKVEKRPIADFDIKTACQSACPTGAITFGDLNNEDSHLNKEIKSKLTYRVLEEVNTQSSVYYQAKILNRNEDIA